MRTLSQIPHTTSQFPSSLTFAKPLSANPKYADNARLKECLQICTERHECKGFEHITSVLSAQTTFPPSMQ